MNKILVIEDEPEILANLEEILALADFTAITAFDGTVGLKLAKAKLPDLIICDVMMPGINGYEVLRRLREDKKTANIPLIFLTAKAERSDLRQGMELGADDYITKPFEVTDVLNAVTARLKRQSIAMQPYTLERGKSEMLESQLKNSQGKLEDTDQLAQLRSNLLQRLSSELRNPVSNINMAIHLLKNAKSEGDRDRYLEILKEECNREIKLLNEIDNLQELLTPENTKLLRQFNLLDS